MVFYVYFLKYWKDKESMKKRLPLYGHIIYVGFTSNIFRRVKEHLTGYKYNKKRPGYTSQFKGNLELGYLEAYNTEERARRREDEFKNKIKAEDRQDKEQWWNRDMKVELIQQFEEEHQKIIKKVMEKARSLI